MHDPQPTERTPNRLAQETSPYLQQHALNPVDWYPWGEEAFEKARQEHKPIFLSVGYSACHWCHVMEHESFENDEIARILNEHYVSVKVDREERPDVDQIYMSAVQLITRRGGWPMSVFLTPEGKPFYGGTYWPPTSRMGMPGFRDILHKLHDFWQNKRDEVETSAAQLVEAIQDMAAPVFERAELNAATLRSAMQALLHSADRKHGGFGGAPKFPHPMDIRVLLRCWKRFRDPQALDTVKLTLEKMLLGGIYDQLGGGFHRYSTDAYWLVPHFEKMLYDNALLVPAYLEAWQETGLDDFRRCVTETLDYVLREMTSESGGFFSTQDADSEGVEGKFFVWSQQEIVDTLGEPAATWFCRAYDVTPGGNWEEANILNRPHPFSVVATELGVTLAELETSLKESRAKLYEVRKSRIPPGRDEKIILAWNGMMIAAMARAGFVLSDARYVTAARAAARFALDHLRDTEGRLIHCYKDGRARFQAYLDDYACFIDGLLELFQATGEAEFLSAALEFSKQMLEHFEDPEQGGFFYTAGDHEALIARTKDVQDNAVPSGNGMAAMALLKLARLCNDPELEQAAVRTLDSFSSLIQEHPRACGQALLAVDSLLGPAQEVVVVLSMANGINGTASLAGAQTALEATSAEVASMLQLLRECFLPNAITIPHVETAAAPPATDLTRDLTTGKAVGPDGIAVYLCQRGSCQSPALNANELAVQLNHLS